MVIGNTKMLTSKSCILYSQCVPIISNNDYSKLCVLPKLSYCFLLMSSIHTLVVMQLNLIFLSI